MVEHKLSLYFSNLLNQNCLKFFTHFFALPKMNGGTWVRNSKSDGASTIVFGIYAKNNGAKLYSVDINPDNIATCQKTIDKMNLSSYVELNTADSIKYLNAFTQKVDFLYLDSYDYNRNKPEIIKDSQAHHLEEIKAVEKKLHENSIILIDDCKLPGGGKGKSAIKYLKSKGWKIVINKYQVLLKK